MGLREEEPLLAAVSGLAADAKIGGYRMDPARWARERLDVYPWSKQVEVLESVRDHKRTAVQSCHGAGKDLPLTTPLPTPGGWVTMETVRVGDQLIGVDGEPVNVVAKSHLMHKPVAEVEFDDGTRIVCGWTHEWVTLSAKTRQRIRMGSYRKGGEVDWRDHWDSAQVHTTRQISETLRNERGQYEHAVPLHRPLHGAVVDFDEPLEKLGAAGVLDERIMRADVHQRVDYFAGLCLGYGSVTAQGHVSLSMPTKELAEFAHRLAITLAYPVYDPPLGIGDDWQLRVHTRCNPFYPENQPSYDTWEKANSTKKRTSRSTIRSIVAVREIRPLVTQCVQVDSDRHAYLAGPQMVPTHNSMIASVAAGWWLDVHPPGEAIVVSTAPTYAQVNKILWEEIRKHHRRVGARAERDPSVQPLVGYVTQSDEWKLDNGEIIGFGRKPADHNIHGFQGIHRRYVLVLIDEACGVASTMWTAVEAITTTGDARILAIGNPDDRDTEFGRVCLSPQESKLWNRVQISAFSTPNFTSEEVPALLRDVLLQREWAEDRLAAWGEDDPRYQAKVLAQFPENSVNSLFGAQVLANAFDVDDVEPDGSLIVAVDPARFGDDSTAVVARRGRVAWVQDSWKGLDTTSSARRALRIVADLRRENEDVQLRVDAIGLGAGVVDAAMAMLAESGDPGIEVVEMLGSSAAQESDGTKVAGYGNARALWYDRTRQYFLNGLQKVQAHDQLLEELQGTRFLYSSGRLFIESKDDIRKRTGGSPDFADALVYACADRPPYDAVEGDLMSATPDQLLGALGEMMAERLNRIGPM